MADIGDLHLDRPAPEGSLPCDGSIMQRADYPDLAGVLDRFGFGFTDLSVIPGTPAANNQVQAFATNEDWIYMSTNSGGQRIDRSDWSISNFTIRAASGMVSIQDGYEALFWGASGSSTELIIITISSGLRRTLNAPGVVNGVATDSQFIYVAHTNAPFISIYDRETLVDQEVIVPNGIGALRSGQAVFSIGEFIYIFHSGSNRFNTYRKHTWDLVYEAEAVASIPHFPYRYSVDGDTIYYIVGTTSNPTLHIMRVADGLPYLIPPLTLTGLSGVKIAVDSNFVYLGTNTSSERIRIMRKDTLELVPHEISIPGNVNAVHSDGKYLFVGHATTPFFTVVNLYQEIPEEYFRLPNIPNPRLGIPASIQAEIV